VRIDADGQNLDLVTILFFEERFQLTKLFGAPRSPIAAIKDQHDGIFAAIIG